MIDYVMYLLISVIVLLILVLLFNPLLLMNAVASLKAIKRHKNLKYANDQRHDLDLYMPKQIDQNKPVVVFVYGGAWDSGHKDHYKFAGVEFAKLGYVTAVPNYRLYPDAKFPHFIEDVAQACASLPDHLSNLDIQVTRINGNLPLVLIGHSAGAHTVSMLNAAPKYLQSAKANVTLKACIGMAGPYDLPLDDPLVIGKFDGVTLHDICEQHPDEGHKHNRHDANPINLATVEMAQTLLMHGRADETVGLYHLERFAQRLEELGVEHKAIIYDKVPHRHMVGGISGMFHFMNPVFQDIRAYLQKLD